jgi:2-hydroxychromene-2-carboxylate isomerase
MTRHRRRLLRTNVFGVPLFIFDREPFWGHDRIAILEERLILAGLAVSSNE